MALYIYVFSVFVLWTASRWSHRWRKPIAAR